jgi:hypothetical protein
MPGDDAQEKKAREEQFKRMKAELEKAKQALAKLSSDAKAARADFEKAEKEVGKS